MPGRGENSWVILAKQLDEIPRHDDISAPGFASFNQETTAPPLGAGCDLTGFSSRATVPALARLPA
jgi:hypothetical protein